MRLWSNKLPETIFYKIAFAFSIAMLMSIGYISFRQLSEVNKTQKKIIRAREKQIEFEKLFSTVKDAERMQRGYIISGDTSFLNNYNLSKRRVAESLSQLQNLNRKKQSAKADLDSLKTFVAKRYQLMDTLMELNSMPQAPAAQRKAIIKQGALQMQRIEQLINKRLYAENIVLQQYEDYQKAKNRFLPYITGLLIVFSLIIFFISFYKIYREIARNKKINSELVIVNQSFQYAEEILQIGHWKRCPDSDRIEWSLNMYRIFGIEPNNQPVTESALLEFVHPDDKPIVSATLKDVHERHIPPRITYRIILQDGTIKHIKTTGKLVVIDNVPLILGTTCDVTAQIEMYNSLEQKNKELQTAVEELASFNHIASHDLQEPLRKIQMFISRIDSEEAEVLSATGKEYFERISISALRMEQLIDDLLLYSQTKKEDHVFVRTDLNATLQEAQQELATEIEEKQAAIIADVLPEISAIPFQMRQLFINLIGNAIKYSKEGHMPRISITSKLINTIEEPGIKLADKEVFYKITITDNGIGFKQEFAEKIFVLFQRLHKKEQYSGTGIGLAICKKIIENHNGFISAESIPGQGSSFQLYLPQQNS